MLHLEDACCIFYDDERETVLTSVSMMFERQSNKDKLKIHMIEQYKRGLS